ncbi:hypothetical protein ABFX02_11G122900 [Erythranthe guttata]
MASKALLIVLACFLLINTNVSSQREEEILSEVISGKPVFPPSPPPIVQPPTPPPIVKAPPPTPPPAIKIPPTPTPTPTPPPAIKTPPPPPPPAVRPPRNRLECIPLCVVRCQNHSRKNVCMRVCLTCCDRCKCVPPGQYGNKEKCGKCYTGMTTTGGRPKCP